MTNSYRSARRYREAFRSQPAKAYIAVADALLDNTLGPRAHHFKVFRLGDDICAKCGKPRAEHPKRGAT